MSRKYLNQSFTSKQWKLWDKLSFETKMALERSFDKLQAKVEEYRHGTKLSSSRPTNGQSTE